MTNKLEQLRSMTTVVSDTGDMEAIRVYKPTDATTNPSLILKAAEMSGYARLVDEAIVWGGKQKASVGEVTDRIAMNFGSELTKIVPGRVSTEVDADLSFDTEGMVAKAKSFIAALQGTGRRPGAHPDQARLDLGRPASGPAPPARGHRLQYDPRLFARPGDRGGDAEGVPSLALRRTHFRLACEGGWRSLHAETDPGVHSVRTIYAYYKTYGIKTVVMGASFRTPAKSRLWRAATASPSRRNASRLCPRRRASFSRSSIRPILARPRRRSDRRKDLPLDDERGPDGDREALRRHSPVRRRPEQAEDDGRAAAGEGGVTMD